MTDKVIERFLDSMVAHDWSTFEQCLADDFTRVGPYGDTYTSKADYVTFLSDLMPTLAGYEMQVTRVPTPTVSPLPSCRRPWKSTASCSGRRSA